MNHLPQREYAADGGPVPQQDRSTATCNIFALAVKCDLHILLWILTAFKLLDYRSQCIGQSRATERPATILILIDRLPDDNAGVVHAQKLACSAIHMREAPVAVQNE